MTCLTGPLLHREDECVTCLRKERDALKELFGTGLVGVLVERAEKAEAERDALKAECNVQKEGRLRALAHAKQALDQRDALKALCLVHIEAATEVHVERDALAKRVEELEGALRQAEAFIEHNFENDDPEMHWDQCPVFAGEGTSDDDCHCQVSLLTDIHTALSAPVKAGEVECTCDRLPGSMHETFCPGWGPSGEVTP